MAMVKFPFVSSDGGAMTTIGRATLLAISAVVASAPCIAHHSGALWDQTRSLTLHGTVTQFQWTNPHCFIQLLVPLDGAASGNAQVQEWNIEMASPFQVLSGGWKPGTLKPGDKIEVTVHPARDGSPSGNFVSAVSAGGHALGQRSPAP
jgi:hypothetical protein